MENKNLGLLIADARPTDFIAGASSTIITTREISDWSLYLPSIETQRSKITDFLDCATMSSGHIIEMQLNYILKTKQLSDEAIHFFTKNGYIANGSFHISKRFNAFMNGTSVTKGNYLNFVGDHYRKDGIVPESVWPTTDDMNWSDFYTAPTQLIIDLGKQALWFLNIQYQWVNKDKIPSILPSAPVQVATEICAGWDSGQTVERCSGQPLQHATCVYGMQSNGEYLDLDHYPPYKQTLASDYELPLNMQYIVSTKPISLRKGMSGSNVIDLQNKLNKQGYILTPDGNFGPMTQAALMNFQRKHNIDSDGIAGPKTFALLDTPPSFSIQDIITQICNNSGVEPELGIAVASAESGLNPKSKLYNPGSNSTDRGLFQWNDKYHSEISDEQAYNPQTATQLFCNAVKQGKLHAYWSASEPNWKKHVSTDILKKYGIV